MTNIQDTTKTQVNVSSEYGRLRAVLLHRPGAEIERMTPMTAHEALYSDILNKGIVDKEYAAFSGVFEKWCKVYYVEDLLTILLDDDDLRDRLLRASCENEGAAHLYNQLAQHPSETLAKELIEGVEYHEDTDPAHLERDRYILRPLYNLFFTRDASSSLYNEVLINTMSFDVRQRETLIYRAIFDQYFHAPTFSAAAKDPNARTEGGDIHVAGPDLLCIGEGIRTNNKGIMQLANRYAQKHRSKFRILVQQLPHTPDSFIHLDMVFTFLGANYCMAYQPMLTKDGLFAGKATTLIECDNGKIKTREYKNILEGLKACGKDVTPVICGGYDPWDWDREQWHSGANFFCLGDNKVIGYQRNNHTIDALNNAGFNVLDADDVCAGKVDMNDYEKFVVTFKASELPRGGGGARCMTMPIQRDDN